VAQDAQLRRTVVDNGGPQSMGSSPASRDWLALRLPLRGLFVLALLLLLVPTAMAATVTINDNQPVVAESVPFTIAGTTDAPAGADVAVTIETLVLHTSVLQGGKWSLTIDHLPLKTGTYNITATIGSDSTTQLLRLQLPTQDNLQRQIPIDVEPVYGRAEVRNDDAALAMTDRWRIAPPPYELDETSHGRLDPYHPNILKGDLPIHVRDSLPFASRFKDRNDLFFVLSGVSDTLAESRTLPTPSGVSTVKPASIHFFGDDNQNVFSQDLAVSAELFEGDTGFKPISQRLKATVIANLTYLRVEENAIVKPDVREGTTRHTNYLALQELFYERKLRDLSPNYDFVSIRIGSQPFSSDFRGFIFTDTNLGVRVFGNYASNKYQYNLALFDRREKDTNSGLNRLFDRRDQQVAVANLYWQDFLRKGFTEEFSVHYLRDGKSFAYDRNGILVRPAPIGVFTPHSIDAVYVGAAGLGHIGRINVDHAVYGVFGRDSLNPLAGPDPALKGGNSVRIGAGMAALELSLDHDWFRPRLGFFYATGDRNPRDRTARGFDSIYDNPNFAGGGFSFFNRLGIKLAGSGVSLVERGSLLPDLKSSKDEGQPNFVNPGVQLVTAGVDIDVTPKLKALVTANYIRLDTTKPIEALLFQDNISRTLGEDLSLGVRYRPFLNNNVVVGGGAAAFFPSRGFRDIYEDQHTLYHVFTSVVLSF
jgi:hypothetical protein